MFLKKRMVMNKIFYSPITLLQIFLFPVSFGALVRTPEKITVVNVPVASLWTKPTETNAPYAYPLFSKDIPTHATQLLYGERVTVLRESNGWMEVQAPQQLGYNPDSNQWYPIQRWIEKKDTCDIANQPTPNLVVTTPWAAIFSTTKEIHMISLCMGTMLYGKPFGQSWMIALANGTTGLINDEDVIQLNTIPFDHISELRKIITDTAHKFLGTPYVWGGCSMHHRIIKDYITGTDCSGLVYLVYRTCGLAAPRNAHAQFIASKFVAPQNLRPGDLAFFAPEESNYGTMNHVMLYIGDDVFIEATGKKGVERTRVVRAFERFGKPLKDCNDGELVGDRDGNVKVYFRTLLWSDEQVASLKMR